MAAGAEYIIRRARHAVPNCAESCQTPIPSESRAQLQFSTAVALVKWRGWFPISPMYQGTVCCYAGFLVNEYCRYTRLFGYRDQ